MSKWLLLAGVWAAFAKDPHDCPTSVAKLKAIETSRSNGNAPVPVPREEWDSFTIEVSEDRSSVYMFNHHPDEKGRMIQTTVNFVRSSDGLWHGDRITLQDGKEIENKKWTQASIPYTRKTIADYRLENGPVAESMLSPFARLVVDQLKIPLASIEQARRELKAEAFGKKPIVWNPGEGLIDAISLATVRLDPDLLLRAVREGQAAFGYSKERVIAQLEGREAFTDTTYDDATSTYGHVIGSLVTMNTQRPHQEAEKALAVILKSLR